MTDTPIPLFEGAVVTWSPLDDGKGEVNLTGTPLRPPNPNDWGTVAVHPLDEVARLVARVEAQATQLADAQQMIRNVLVNISDALGLPLSEAGRPRANSFLYREIGRFIECHDWDWPPQHPGEVVDLLASPSGTPAGTHPQEET